MQKIYRKIVSLLNYNLHGSLSSKVSCSQTTFLHYCVTFFATTNKKQKKVRQCEIKFITTAQCVSLYYDNLFNHRIYRETVHHNHCLTPANLELSHHEGWYTLNRIEVIVDLPKVSCHFFITNKFAKLFIIKEFNVQCMNQ